MIYTSSNHSESQKLQKLRYTSFAAEGGGVCGIAYAGAIRAMEEADLLKDLKNFAGTSAGAIVATALACGATSEYIEKKLGTVDFNDFLDNSWGILRDIYRLWTKHGWNRGDTFLKWMEEIMSDLTGNPNITIEEVYKRYGSTIVLVAWNNSMRCPIYFTRKTYPNMAVKDAVRMSMSVPLLFKSCWLTIDGKQCEIVDGGIGHNYPLTVFDFEEYCSPEAVSKRRETQSLMESGDDYSDNGDNGYGGDIDICNKFINHETIGFRVDNKDDFDFESKKWTDTSNLKSSLQSLVTSIYILSQKVSESPSDLSRTVRINCGTIFPFDFGINADDRKLLLNAGYQATKDYILSKTKTKR
jgi:NTE family protein